MNTTNAKELTAAADNALRLLEEIQRRALALRDSSKLPPQTEAIYDVRAIHELARDAAGPLRTVLGALTLGDDALAALRGLAEPADLGEIDLDDEDRAKLETARDVLARADALLR